ncbi:hypothetical protein Tco_0365269 [Tanacetum coccineum]
MKCYSDDPLVVPIDGLHIGAKLQIVEEPVEIMDREVKRLKQSRFPIVKVRWNSKRGPEFTWEREDQFKKKHPHLFIKTAPSSSAASLKMDNLNITMEEYIRLQKEKALSRGETFNWQTSTYAISCGPTVSLLNDNKFDFRISFDKSDDEDYTLVYDENSFSYKIIYVNNLKMDSENDNDKVNMPSFPSPEPEVGYFNDLDFFKDFENEFPAIVYNGALISKLDILTEPTISP